MNTPSIQDGTVVSPPCLAGTVLSASPGLMPEVHPSGRPLHESWHLTLLDPDSRRALYLRYSILISTNGFRKIADVAGAFSERVSAREVAKCALRQSFEIGEYRRIGSGTPGLADGLRIGSCELSGNRATGSIRSKGKTLEWDLSLESRQTLPAIELIPPSLQKSGLFSQSLLTPFPTLRVSGSFAINGRSLRLSDAPGMVARESGKRDPHSGIRAHCNHFRDERGAAVPFVFKGLSFRGHILGAIPSPRFTSLCFIHRGRKFQFNSLRDAIRLKSRVGLNDWHFQAEEGDLLFRGHARFDHQDFTGLSHEDTTGSLIYTSHSMLSDLEIQVLRRGKIDLGLRSGPCASVELIGREKSPYVQLMT